MNYGFIGTGTIAEAMIVGMMASSLPVGRVVVSPRNAQVASRLAAAYARVDVAASNQEVVDEADVLVLAVRFQIAQEVLQALSFPERLAIISVIAATSHEKLAAWTGRDAKTIVRAIPLPFVARRDGVTAIFPGNPQSQDLFEAIGTAVACASEQEFDLFAATSSTMGTYFGLLERLTEWLCREGLDEAKARSYVLPLFASLAHAAVHSPDAGFAELRQEFSTKGGLNERVFHEFESGGGSKALTHALDLVLKRIRG